MPCGSRAVIARANAPQVDNPGIQHYRRLFLAKLALKPLVDTFGLHQPAVVLSWVLESAAIAGWLIIASVAY